MFTDVRPGTDLEIEVENLVDYVRIEIKGNGEFAISLFNKDAAALHDALTEWRERKGE